MNFSNYPILKILISYIIGIIIADTCHFSSNLLFLFFSTALLFLLISLLLYKFLDYKWLWISGIMLNLAFCFAGIMMSILPFYPENSSKKSELLSQNQFWIATISDNPTVNPNYVKVIAKIECTTENFPVNEKAILYFKSSTDAEKLHYGDLLLLHSQLSPIEAPKNPYSFDYKQFMKRKGIEYSGFVNGDAFWILKSAKPVNIRYFAFCIQQFFSMQFADAGMSGDEYGIITAILLGNDDTMEPELKASYASTGVSHILSVSGMHVGIIFMILDFLLKPLEFNKRSRFIKALILLLSIWFYANITGLSPSVSRAAAMFTFVTFGTLLRRNTNIFHSLFASLLILLIINPLLLYDIGFQLSYLAIFGIVIFQKPFLSLWKPKNKIVRYFWELITVSLAAQLGTFPVAVYYFGQFPNYFLQANLAVVLLSFIIVVSGVVLLFVSFSSLLSSWVGFLLIYEIKGMNLIIQTIEKLPYSVTKMIDYNILQVILLYLIILGIYLFFIKKHKKYCWIVLSSFALFSINFSIDKFHYSKKEEITIYSINKITALNFNYHGKSILLSDSIYSKDNKQYIFSIQNHERKEHIDSQIFSLSENGAFHDYGFYKEGNFILFLNKSFYLLNREQLLFPVNQKIKVDYLLLVGNPKIPLEKVKKCIDFKEVIICGSTSSFYANRWIEACQKEAIPCHSTREAGFFKINCNL